MMDKSAMKTGKRKIRSLAQAGNAIVMLFAAIGMAGVVTYGLNNVIRGPAVTTAELSRRTIAENNLVATTRLAIASATNQQASGGDCDGDGFVEPLPYRDAGAGPHPTGGGYIPSTMGASMSDPWGNQYGYCVWDPGTVSVSDAMPACGGATPRRLQGAPRDDQYALAVISAGRNGVFETQCRDYIDANADNVPDNIMLEEAPGGDDLVLAYTYAEANGIGGGEWKLKDGAPDTAEIGKNIALGSASNPRGAAFNDGLELGGARGLILPRDPGDDTVTGACDANKANQLRLNIGDGTAVPVLEVCHNNAWTVVSGGTNIPTEPACTTLGPWTRATSSGDLSWGHFHDVVYANNQFVTISSHSNVAATSPDGITWTQRSVPAGEWYRLAYGNGVYVAVGSAGTNRVISSPDGITWTARTPVEVSEWADVAFGNGIFVAVSNTGTNRVMTSSDGATWTARTPSEVANWSSVRFLDGRFVAAANGGAGERLMSSPDGINWTTIVNNANPFYYRINYNGEDTYLTVGASDYAVTTDPTLSSWSYYTIPSGMGNVNTSASGGGRFIIVGFSGNPQIATSQDGISWTTMPSPSGVWVGAGYGDGKFIVTGFNGEIMYAECSETAAGYTPDAVPLTTPHPLDEGMIAHWKMDEGTGTTVTDSVGDYDGTLVNTPQWATSGPTGASSLTFQHDDRDAVQITGLLDEPAHGTIAAWVNVANVEPYSAEFLSLGDNVALREHIDRGLTLIIYNGGSVWGGVPSDIRIRGTGWRHVVGTWEDAIQRVYVDGILVAQVSGSAVDYSLGGNTFIGRHGGANTDSDMDGGIDDMRVYNRALSPLEVQQLYERSLGGSEVRKNTPPSVLAYTQGSFISAGREHTCAIKNDGSTWCWGDGADGRLGNNLSTTATFPSPVRVQHQSIHTFRQISAGRLHTCGVTADNSGWCWGSDTSGQRGDGTTTTGNAIVPTLVSGGSVWSQISAGYSHSCGIRTNGTLWCWGLDDDQQLGNGSSTTTQTSPVAIGTALYSQVETGENHTCAIRTDGSLWCWGLGTGGKIGDGSTTTRNAPTAVMGTNTWKDVALEGTRTCGITTEGALYCWGNGVTSPQKIETSETWTNIDISFNHTCALRTDGSLWCWGDDALGQLGNGAATTTTQAFPQRVNLPGPISAFSVGRTHTCAAQAAGDLWCWGEDAFGKLGNGTVSFSSATPDRVVGFPNLSPWIWNSAANTFQLNGSMTIALGDKWLSDDGTARYFGFESAGKARLRQTGSSNQLLVETAAATNSAQVSFKKGTPASTADNTTLRVAEWLFNETTGTTAASSVGTFPGTLSGRTSWNPTGGRTSTNGVLEFDGITGRVSVANNATLRPSGSFTIRAWVRPDGVQNPGAVILSKSYNNGQHHSYALRVSADQKVEFVTTNASLAPHVATSIETLRANAWTLIEAFFFDFGGGIFTKAIAINGGQAFTSSSVSAIAYSTDATGNLFFGSGGCVSPCNAFRGAIDEVRLYSGVYNSSAWTDMYNFNTSHVVPKAIGIDHSTNNLEIGTQNATATNWLSAITPDLALTSTGDLGLGNAAPATKVDVSGSARVGFESSCTAASTGAIRYTGNIADESRFSCPASSWTLRDASSAGQWSDIVYANGLFVAVGQWNGTNGVMTSPDGINWTNRTTPNQNWQAVTYGNGLFVAVTYDNYANVITSPDGITWTPRSIPATGWETIKFLNGAFYALRPGTTGALMRSTNGINWTSHNLPTSQTWRQIAYGNGIYLATAAAVGASAYSYDGLTWIAGNTTAGANQGTAFGGGMFVTGMDGTNMRYSYDGINWTSTTIPNMGTVAHILYANGQFIAMGLTGTNRIAVSSNGINWTSYAAPQANAWRGIAYGNGRYVAVSEGGSNRVMTSDCSVISGGDNSLPTGAIGYWKFDEASGTTAADSAGSNPGTLNGNATFGPGRKGNALVLDGSGDFANMGSAASLDNLPATSACAWVNGPASQPGTYQGIVNKTDGSGQNGYSLYVGDQRGTTNLEFGSTTRNNGYREEADLVAPNTWTHICSTWDGTNPTTALKIYVNGVEINTGLDYDFAGSGSISDASYNFVVGGTVGSYFQGSIDEVVLYNRVLSATEVGQVMSATGASGGLPYQGPYTCTAQNWTVTGNISVTGSLTFGNGQFVAVGGYPEQVATSTDGISWTYRTHAAGWGWFSDIVYANGQYVVVSYDGPGRVMTSPDGINWTGRTAAELNGWVGITYGEGLYVAVATSGTNRVMTSPDGITWTARSTPTRAWEDVAYGNGIFVAMTADGDRRMTSPDGITWTEQATTNGWGRVAFGDGLFLISRADGIETTTDGVTLTNQSVPAGDWYSMAYDATSDLWVAVSYQGTNRVMTSPDAVNWTARTVPSTANFNQVAIGNGRIVALAGNGTVMISTCSPVEKFQYCNGTAWSDFIPVTTTYWKKDPLSIAAGWGFTDDASVCSIASTGLAYCWGDANNNGLGNNQNTVDSLIPTKVHDNASATGWSDWMQITGIENRCGLRANGTIWCWGYNWNGRLGDGNTGSGQRPVQVQTNTGPGAWNDWIQVSGWMDHFCGLRSNGTAWCWGSEREGQLGNGASAGEQSRPVQVQTDTGPGGWSDWIQIEGGWSNSCGLRRGGTVWCWGRGDDGELGNGGTTDQTRPVQLQTDTGPGGWDDWTQISFADAYGCGIREDGSAWCWGGFADHQRRGTNCTAGDSRPKRVRTSTNGAGWNDWRMIKAGRDITCGIRNDGSLWCWGINTYGAIGNNSTTNSCLPVEVHSSSSATGWKDWMNVAIGRGQTCGVRANGSLWCWGTEVTGQLGNNSASTTLRLRPVAVTSPP